MVPCGLHTGLAPPIVGHTCTWTCEHAGLADLVGSRPHGRHRGEVGWRTRSRLCDVRVHRSTHRGTNVNTVPRMGRQQERSEGVLVSVDYIRSRPPRCSHGQARRRAADGNATAAGGRYRRRPSLRRYNVACIRAFICMCSCASVMDSWCRQRRGCACFPGCAVATPRTGVPSQGQCTPPIARATFGAPRRCDALRFLLPLQAVKKTAISQKAQRGRATSVASRHTGCWHTRCRQCTMPRFQGTCLLGASFYT